MLTTTTTVLHSIIHVNLSVLPAKNWRTSLEQSFTYCLHAFAD